MAKKKLNKNWLHDHINDPYVKLAQKEGYRARAAYKLKEIDEAVKLLRPGQIVVDLGSTPGSWSQYVRNRFAGGAEGKLNGTIIGLDILPMEPIADITFIQGDFREESVLHQLETILAGRQVDVVLSDMAPNLSGIVSSDAARVEEIIELALQFGRDHLKPDGVLLAKCFNGSGYNDVLGHFRKTFKQVSSHKPKASRDKSSEIFLLGRKMRSEIDSAE